MFSRSCSYPHTNGGEVRVLPGTVFSTVSCVPALEGAKAVAVPKQNVEISVVAIIALKRNLNPTKPPSYLAAAEYGR
jgi:hypothetical protein